MTVRLRRCPKCHSVEVCWREVTETVGTYTQTKDGISLNAEFNPGAITGVTGWCPRCDHEWTPRGVDGKKAYQLWCLPGGVDRVDAP